MLHHRDAADGGDRELRSQFLEKLHKFCPREPDSLARVITRVGSEIEKKPKSCTLLSRVTLSASLGNFQIQGAIEP
jgi:hypothetical protein